VRRKNQREDLSSKKIVLQEVLSIDIAILLVSSLKSTNSMVAAICVKELWASDCLALYFDARKAFNYRKKRAEPMNLPFGYFWYSFVTQH
jgi:hypothetical protein